MDVADKPAITLMRLDAVVAAIRKRAAHYERKASEADPFAENRLTEHEKYEFAVEALEYLEAEIVGAAKRAPTASPPSS